MSDVAVYLVGVGVSGVVDVVTHRGNQKAEDRVVVQETCHLLWADEGEEFVSLFIYGKMERREVKRRESDNARCMKCIDTHTHTHIYIKYIYVYIFVTCVFVRKRKETRMTSKP